MTGPVVVTQPAAAAGPEPSAAGAPSEAAAELAAMREPVAPETAGNADGSLAARLRGQLEQAKKRRRAFRIPPEDVWGDSLVLVAKPFTVKGGMRTLQVVVEATAQVLVRDDDHGTITLGPEHGASPDEFPGSYIDVGGWAGLGQLMGVGGDQVTLGQIITAVMTSDDVIAGLGDSLVGFSMGRRGMIERALGE